MRKIGLLLLLLIPVILTTACKTQKKRGEYSAFGKFWHNTNAYFNGYFNANLLLEESFIALTDQHEENYNKVLPVFPYVEADNPQAVAANLDIAVEKVTVVATIHEFSNWTDDCYLMIGKCQYLKQDYESAEETLEYMSREFTEEKIMESRQKVKKSKRKKRKRKSPNQRRRKKSKRKRKKSSSSKKQKEASKEEEEFDDTFFLKHRPAHQEGLLWLARTYVERDRFRDAEKLLTKLEENKKTYEEIRDQLAPVKAHLYLRRKNYTNAIPPLERAAKSAKEKNERARYYYILAQLYEMEDQNSKAFASFEKAAKYSKSYDMSFHARLSMEKNSWAKGNTSTEEALKRLARLLKDDKNKEYIGQIYFTMAKVALKQGDKKKGIEYLEKSVNGAGSTPSQLAESYYLLATLYFEAEDFVNAKTYYDQALSVLSEKDERYDEVKLLSENLADIAANLEIITLQDSLLKISQMSEKEQKEFAAKLVKKRKKEAEERAAELAAANKAAAPAPQLRNLANRTGAGGGKAPSTYVFYDPNKVTKGIRDFEKVWGTRTREDNWRRSNRPDKNENQAQDTLANSNDLVLGDSKMEEVLKDVPRTQEEINEANEKIKNALFELGTLYRDKLGYNENAVETLEELLNRYPGNDHELEAFYYLYIAHTDLGNIQKAKEYFNKICNSYPESIYCKILRDPSYAEEEFNKEKKLDEYYEITYDLFDQGEYQNALDRSQQIPEKFEQLMDNKHPLRPKFALLTAFCLGQLSGEQSYVKALKDVVAKYPDTPEETRAKEILRFFEGGGGEEDPKNDVYVTEDDKLHYSIILLKDKGIKLDDAKIAVSNFNTKYYRLQRLRISNIFLGADTDTPILVIRRFKNKKDAMDYYSGVQNNKADFITPDGAYELFMINQSNYRQIIKQRSLDGYKEFFDKNYLKNYN